MQIDKLIRSNRRSLSIEITADVKVIVRAPRRMPKQEIEKFVLSRTDWIESKIKIVCSRPKKMQHMLTEGEVFWYLGEPFLLKHSSEVRGVQLQDNYLLVPDGKQYDQICSAIILWYQGEAKKILNQRLSFWAQQIGLTCTGMKITSAKTRWGSCTAKNSINFSWYLIMAPVQSIDAVVVHELCHTVYHNHSAQFWNAVYHAMPDYKERHIWLNENSQLLRLEFAESN